MSEGSGHPIPTCADVRSGVIRMRPRSGATACGLALIVLLVTGWGALLLADRQLISWLTDDTFYYLQIARNVAGGAGFTFDGIHRTNGFHPLWMFLLVPLFSIVHGDFLPLRILILVQAILLAGA